jgi:hypothetical protein
MAPNRPDRILGEWSAVAHTATPPAPAPVAADGRSGPGISVLGAAVAALLVVVALAWLSNREEVPGVGGDPTPTPPAATASPIPSLTPSPSASPTPTIAPTTAPLPSLTATPGAIDCTLGNLVARITRWEGAAGHRIADVEVTNAGAGPCFLPTLARPQLVDGNGDVLIDGTSPVGSSLSLKPGGKATTLVDADNYCGPAPLAPVSVAFVMGGPDQRLIAAPVSPKDATVPPCNGPGAPASIEMHPWAP